MIPILGMFMGGGASPYEHKPGETTNYADAGFRQDRIKWQAQQRARGPGTGGDSGWNRESQGVGSGGGSGGRRVARKDYWLGKPSQEFYDKFSKWGEQGPRGDEGWKYTLSQAPTPQSTTAPTQKFDQEVFQTRETRIKGSVQQFQILKQHSNTPRLNPNLAYMYKEKNMQLGAVRRTARRFL